MTTLDLTVATREELIGQIDALLALPDGIEHVVDRVVLALRSELKANPVTVEPQISDRGHSEALKGISGESHGGNSGADGYCCATCRREERE